VLLTDNFIQRARPQALGQRRIRLAFGEQVAHRVST
jgi:hypothetical protein